MRVFSEVSGPTAGEDSIEERRQSAIKGAFLSEFIDMFDIYLPAVVLSPVLFVFHPPEASSGMDAILNSLVFVTTLLGRPIGAILFGVVADRMGRRMASILSVSGFGLITTMIAFLPGYQTIGIASYWLLVLLRFLDGICLGGGYTGVIPLAFEYSEKHRRGFVGGFIMAGFPGAYVVINLMAMIIFTAAPLAGPDSAYAVWGWRVPFIIGGLLSGMLALYYVFKVAESEIWECETGGGASSEKLPLTDLIFGRSGKILLQVLLLMTGFWLTQNIITIFVPSTLLLRILHLSGFELTLTLLISYSVLIFTYLGSGMLAQRIGRRTFFMILGPIISTVGAGILLFLTSGGTQSLFVIIAAVVVLSIIVTAPWGVIITYINERFVTDVRATGFGVGFSLSVIIPSFYAFYMECLRVRGCPEFRFMRRGGRSASCWCPDVRR